MAHAQRVFDTHVHIWNGETSVRAYEAQLKATHQTVTRFAGILIAERGKWWRLDARTMIDRAGRKTFPRCSRWHRSTLRRSGALDEVRRIAELGVTVIKLHPHISEFAITDPR